MQTQHSALSTQHSALSTQYSYWLRFLLSTCLCFFGFSVNVSAQYICSLDSYGYYSGPASSPASFFAAYKSYAGYPYAGCTRVNPDVYLEYDENLGSVFHEDSSSIRYLISYSYFHRHCNSDVVVTPQHSGVYEPGRHSLACGKLLQSTLTLTPVPQTPPDPRPDKTGGKSTLELIAKVTENGSPKEGVAVTFAVAVIANSGGHDHHDASRPKGEVMANSLETDANGEIKVTFQASEFAGTHVVAAACSSCTNTSVTKNIDVKVPDLIAMQASSGAPLRYTLEGNTSAAGVNHKGNHYFTSSAQSNLGKLIDFFNSFGWMPVGINDASIKWGGGFDIYGRWGNSHAEHRIGEEVDLGFATGTNASKINLAYYEVCKEKKVDIPSTILWHDIPRTQGGKYDPHFHVRLSGTYTKGPSTGKPAQCSRDSGK